MTAVFVLASLIGLQTSGSAEEKTNWDIRVNPFIDMHYWIRAQASGQIKHNDSCEAAVLAAGELNKDLGGALGWGIFEDALTNANSAAESLKICASLPQTLKLRDGRSFALRDKLSHLLMEYEKIEPVFLKDVWPAHQTEIQTRAALLKAKLLPHQAECFANVIKSLAMEDPKMEIPVYLVAAAPWPGAVTHRRHGGGGVCFIGPQDSEGSQLYEIVLHESIHALDIATDKQSTALNQLREALTARGISPKDKAYHDVPHTLMFVQAAHTIRSVIDKQHKDYGDVAGYYAKVPEATKAVREPWTRYLDGKIDLKQAIGQIADRAAAGATSKP